MDWFRSYHGAPTDNKWLLIAKRAGVKPIHVSGTWWALLDHASQHSDRGRVDDFDVETFALFAGMEEDHVSRIVTTLRDKGLIVEGRIVQWTKRQPKREDDTAAARKAKSRANTGGKLPEKGGADTPDRNAGHAMSRTVTQCHDREEERREDSSDAIASGTVVPHPAADFVKAIFDSGVTLLTATGVAERNARSLVGRLRQKLNDDPAMLTILRQAEIDQPSDPAAWLTAAVETRNGTRQPIVRAGSGQSSRASRLIAAKQRAAAEGGDGGYHSGDGYPLPAERGHQ